MGFKKKVQETPKKINLLNEDEEAKEFILKKQKNLIYSLKHNKEKKVDSFVVHQ